MELKIDLDPESGSNSYHLSSSYSYSLPCFKPFRQQLSTPLAAAAFPTGYLYPRAVIFAMEMLSPSLPSLVY